jgi:hypothetical protein
MLRMGNPEPPPRFVSKNGFLRFLERKEFRGALALDDLFALVAPNGNLMGIELSYCGAVGFTPVPIRGPRQGDGELDYGLSASEQEMTFRIWQTFKMSRLVDFGQWIVMGSRATSATLKAEYTLRKDGTGTIDLLGFLRLARARPRRSICAKRCRSKVK